MVFQSRLDWVKKTVDEGLAVFFTIKRQETKKISPHCLMLVDSVAELTMRGGKRTRAFLCWLGAQTATDNKQKAVNTSLVQAMMALELFQTFALIHDDIIDEDTVRRGGPTVHVKLGVPMAILAGDLALVWADELMGKAGEMNIYSRMKQEVIFGQSLDVMEEHMKIGISKQLIDVYKTAWYTVIRPLQIGASFGGADKKTLEAYVPYGLAVGEAYQLRDDFLDGAVGEDVFVKKARKLQERVARAIKKLTVPQTVSALFDDFARFALVRKA